MHPFFFFLNCVCVCVCVVVDFIPFIFLNTFMYVYGHSIVHIVVSMWSLSLRVLLCCKIIQITNQKKHMHSL